MGSDIWYVLQIKTADYMDNPQEGCWNLTQQYLLCFVCLFGFIFQAWDLGFGFDMNILYKTGWFVFIGSMGAAAALAYFLWIKLEFCDLTKYRETEEF